MIDFWLILCQLVPFVQVVLLTAMEYLREEELEKEEKTKTVDAITQYDMGNEEEYGPETKEAWKLPQKKRSKEAYVPMLMVIEKKVLPLAVLVAFIIYFGIAARFYFE